MLLLQMYFIIILFNPILHNEIYPNSLCILWFIDSILLHMYEIIPNLTNVILGNYDLWLIIINIDQPNNLFHVFWGIHIFFFSQLPSYLSNLHLKWWITFFNNFTMGTCLNYVTNWEQIIKMPKIIIFFGENFNEPNSLINTSA